MTYSLARDLNGLLARAAFSNDDRGIKAYPLGNTTDFQEIRYYDLHHLALQNSSRLKKNEGFHDGSIVLLHFESHLDNIIWFWSVLYAGCIPAFSTPFAQNPEHRDKHLHHLRELLRDPVCLTTSNLLDKFPKTPILALLTIETLSAITVSEAAVSSPRPISKPSDIAILMLTSGSTGNAKAVCISHEQILASVAGKSAALFLELSGHCTFFNWIGLDHVGSLVEIHLHAMFLVVNQVHAQAPDIIAYPTSFLHILSRHSVARTFAPNFFLAKLKAALEKQSPEDYDLSCLRYILSGGEANVVSLCTDVSQMLTQYGAPASCIVPGFGMTETCAGSIYNLDCPAYDLERKHEFASLGECVRGIKMRASSMSSPGCEVKPGEPGNLEVTGPIVFKSYYNNPEATAEAFTADGWFKTGDIAIIDSQGKLNLAGRTKDTITINGVKYLPHEIEAAIEEAAIPGVIPSFTLCFSYRAPKAQTEQCYIVYLPSYPTEDTEARIRALNAITKVVALHTRARPCILPLDSCTLEKTTLGKLSRNKIRSALERGDLRTYVDINDKAIAEHRSSRRTSPCNELERMLLEELEDVLELPKDEFGVDSSIFDFGMSSVDLIKYKRRIEVRLRLKTEVPMITIMTHPEVRALANVLQTFGTAVPYDPVVTLQSHGEETPLWLFHPGVGEVLVFLGLANFIHDRPVHALRARGFNPGEPCFQSIAEAVGTYHAAIKSKQPAGPYALAGYSYGSMLAFETAKRLERDGEKVVFLGCFNLPPHIKFRMRQLVWTQCLLHLAYFLDLVPETSSQDMKMSEGLLDPGAKADAVARIMEVAAPSRVAELSVTAESLSQWADVSFSLQSMACDYEPTGKVSAMDVFYCDPLAIVAQSKQDWLDGHLRAWGDFCETAPRFHEVDGSHYTMIGPDHVQAFHKRLKKALRARACGL